MAELYESINPFVFLKKVNAARKKLLPAKRLPITGNGGLQVDEKTKVSILPEGVYQREWEFPKLKKGPTDSTSGVGGKQ